MNNVDVWSFPLTGDCESIGAADRLLSDAERHRRARRCNAILRRRFTLFWGSVRVLLARATDDNAADLSVSRSASGKPIWDNAADRPTFSVSHCGDFGVLAMAQPPLALGVDLEAALADARAARLLRRYGTKDEQTCWQHLPVACRSLAFLRWWTSRESWAKAFGGGLYASFGRGSLNLDDETAGFTGTVRPPGYFAHLDVINADKIALMTVCSARPPRCRHRTLDHAELKALLRRATEQT